MAASKKKAKAKKPAAKAAPPEPEEGEGGATLDSVLKEMTSAPEKARVDRWESVECPYCGENLEIHVTSDDDGQTMSEDCQVCSRTMSIFIHQEGDELEVNAHRA